MLSARFAPKNICFKIAGSPSGSLADVDTPDELLDAVEAYDADDEGKKELAGRREELKKRLEAEQTKIISITKKKIEALHAALHVKNETHEAIENFMNEMKKGVESPEETVVEKNETPTPETNMEAILEEAPKELFPDVIVKHLEQPVPTSPEYKKRTSSFKIIDFVHGLWPEGAQFLAKILGFGDFEQHKQNINTKENLIALENKRAFKRTLGKIVRFDEFNNEQFNQIVEIAKKSGLDLSDEKQIKEAFIQPTKRSVGGEYEHCHYIFYGMNELQGTLPLDPVERFQLVLSSVDDPSGGLEQQVYAQRPLPTPPPAPEETIEEETKLTLSEELQTSVTTIMSEIDNDDNGALRRYLFTGEEITDAQADELGNTNNAINGFKSKATYFIDQVANSGILEKIGYQGEWNDSTPAQTIALVAAEIAHQADLEQRGADHLKQQLVQDYAESWHKSLTNKGLSVKLEDISIEEPVMTSQGELFQEIKLEMKKDIDEKVLAVTKKQAKEALQRSVKKEGEDLITYIKKLEDAFHDDADKAQLISFLKAGFEKTAESLPDFQTPENVNDINRGFEDYFGRMVKIKRLSQTLRNRITVFSNTDSKGRLGGMTWDDSKKISSYEAKNLINLALIEGGDYLAASTGLMNHLDTDAHENDGSIKNSSEKLDSMETIEKVIREKVARLNEDADLPKTLIATLETQIKKGLNEKEYTYYIMGELEAKIAQLKKQNSTKLAESIRELGRQNFTTLAQWQKGEFEPFVPKESNASAKSKNQKRTNGGRRKKPI